MRIFLFILLLGVFVPTASLLAQDEAPVWDNSTQIEDRSIFAFVGKKVFIEKRNIDQFMDFELADGRIIERKIPRLNDRFETRYEVLDIVKGPIYESETIDFSAYDHYGRPHFPLFETVLLFLINDGGEWVRMRRYIPVQRTTDGDWAMCGSMVREGNSEAKNKLAASYEEKIQVERMIFRDEKQFPKNEKSEFCSTGTRAINIYKFMEHTSFGPERRRISCNREIGINDGFVAGTGPHPEAEVEGVKHAACVERLEAEEGLTPK